MFVAAGFSGAVLLAAEDVCPSAREKDRSSRSANGSAGGRGSAPANGSGCRAPLHAPICFEINDSYHTYKYDTYRRVTRRSLVCKSTRALLLLQKYRQRAGACGIPGYRQALAANMVIPVRRRILTNQLFYVSKMRASYVYSLLLLQFTVPWWDTWLVPGTWCIFFTDISFARIIHTAAVPQSASTAAILLCTACCLNCGCCTYSKHCTTTAAAVLVRYYLFTTSSFFYLPGTRYSSIKLQGCVRYGTYRYIPPVLPVPNTWVSSVRHGYRYRRYRFRLSYRYHTLRQVRCSINTGTGHFGKFGTASIPVPDTSVSSVQYQYQYRTLR